MKNQNTRYILLLAGFVLFSCTGKEQQSPATQDQSGTMGEQQTTIMPDQPGTIKVARQIVYDVEIKNPYPDDQWMTECLEGLDHDALVNFVFEGIYNEKFSAFDIFEGTPISSRKIKKMEEEGTFSRDRIGKFQFMEEWFLDTIHMTYSKKVTEVRMGLQKFNENSELTGYDPLFRVVL